MELPAAQPFDDLWPAEMFALQHRLKWPNLFMNWPALKILWRHELENSGEAYLWLERDLSGEVVSVRLVESSYVVRRTADGVPHYSVLFGGREYEVTSGYFIHTRRADPLEADVPTVVEGR